MVASISRPIGRPSGPFNERCVPIRDALKLPEVWPIGVIRAENDGQVTSEEIDSSKVRVGDYLAHMRVTGCIPEHEHESTETITAVVNCPEDAAARCAGCILNLVDGERLQRSMKPSLMLTGITRD